MPALWDRAEGPPLGEPPGGRQPRSTSRTRLAVCLQRDPAKPAAYTGFVPVRDELTQVSPARNGFYLQILKMCVFFFTVAQFDVKCMASPTCV